jgi:hypothetical protein
LFTDKFKAPLGSQAIMATTNAPTALPMQAVPVYGV